MKIPEILVELVVNLTKMVPKMCSNSLDPPWFLGVFNMKWDESNCSWLALNHFLLINMPLHRNFNSLLFIVYIPLNGLSNPMKTP